MITWRGWGLMIPVIGCFPLIMTVPFIPPAPADGPAIPITGYFVWAPLLSALLNFGFARLLRRWRNPRQDAFMGITAKGWTPIFVLIALGVVVGWAVEKFQ